MTTCLTSLQAHNFSWQLKCCLLFFLQGKKRKKVNEKKTWSSCLQCTEKFINSYEFIWLKNIFMFIWFGKWYRCEQICLYLLLLEKGKTPKIHWKNLKLTKVRWKKRELVISFELSFNSFYFILFYLFF